MNQDVFSSLSEHRSIVLGFMFVLVVEHYE